LYSMMLLLSSFTFSLTCPAPLAYYTAGGNRMPYACRISQYILLVNTHYGRQ
jgi:hypothetical protein